MEGTAPGTAVLVGPSGKNWFVELTVVENGIFLEDGWVDFVRDHFLEEGDSIVFRYDGDLNFTLQIFDQSMCEKVAAFSAESSQDLSKYDTSVVKKRSALIDSIIIGGVPKKLRCSHLHSVSNHTEEEWVQQGDVNSNMKNAAVTLALPLTAVSG